MHVLETILGRELMPLYEKVASMASGCRSKTA
jgi:hypothetical protein